MKPSSVFKVLCQSGFWCLAFCPLSTWLDHDGSLGSWIWSSSIKDTYEHFEGIRRLKGRYRQTSIFGVNFSWPVKSIGLFLLLILLPMFSYSQYAPAVVAAGDTIPRHMVIFQGQANFMNMGEGIVDDSRTARMAIARNVKLDALTAIHLGFGSGYSYNHEAFDAATKGRSYFLDLYAGLVAEESIIVTGRYTRYWLFKQNGLAIQAQVYPFSWGKSNFAFTMELGVIGSSSYASGGIAIAFNADRYAKL